ncbi:MAG TPA: hypothetical protein VGB15_23775 [Longimicrobium sp.]|jgi:hypothetical protein
MALSALVSLIISGAALTISATTAWLTLFRRGSVKMTRPRLIYFGWENTPRGRSPKIFLRSLIFSEGKRGHVIQSMYLRVRRENTGALFTAWAYGERNDLVPGSGLFINQEGVTYNHHFLSASEQRVEDFGFTPGKYTVEIHADVLGKKRHIKLGEIQVTLPNECSAEMYRRSAGVLFDWDPDCKDYLPEVSPEHDPVSLSPAPRLRPGL